LLLSSLLVHVPLLILPFFLLVSQVPLHIFVLIFLSDSYSGSSYVDRYSSYLDAFKLPKNKGPHSVAFSSARLESKSTKQLINAYNEIFGKLTPAYHLSDCRRLEDGYEAAKKLLQLPERPTAIYANGDEVAGGMYLYTKSQQMKIPTDLAIIGQ